MALVCLVSVAFFASCQPEVTNPEPSLAIMTGENYVYDGQTIDLNQDYLLGFRAASNSQTGKELASFNLVGTLFDMDGNEYYSEDTTYTISGSEYEYQETLNFGTRELVGKVTFTATVIDVDGKMKSTTISLNINQPAVALEAKDITWVRRGSNSQNADEMAEYGLQWLARDAYHANIQPLNGCTLYVINDNAAAFEGVTTDLEKAAYFVSLAETSRPVDEYRNISTAIAGDSEYNDVLAVIDAEGNQHLILFAKANIQTGSFGVQTTITGQVK